MVWVMPLKFHMPLNGFEPQSNTWFPWTTRVDGPNVIPVGSAVIAQLAIVFNRHHTQTDHAASVTIGRIFALRASDEVLIRLETVVSSKAYLLFHLSVAAYNNTSRNCLQVTRPTCCSTCPNAAT